MPKGAALLKAALEARGIAVRLQAETEAIEERAAALERLA